MNVIKDILLISNPFIEGLGKYLNELSFSFIPVFLYLGAIIEYLSNWDFKGLGKRLVQSSLSILLIAGIMGNSVKTSIHYAHDLVMKNDSGRGFIKEYLSSAKAAQRFESKDWDWKKFELLTKANKYMKEVLGKVIFSLGAFIYILLKLVYTVVYGLFLCTAGFCCALSILPISRDVITGVYKSWLWLLLMPFVVAIILLILDSSEAYISAGNIESIIHFVLYGFILLFSPVFTMKIISSTGVASAAGDLTSKTAIPFAFGTAKAIHSKGVKPSFSRGKNIVRNLIKSGVERREIAKNFSSLNKSSDNKLGVQSNTNQNVNSLSSQEIGGKTSNINSSSESRIDQNSSSFAQESPQNNKTDNMTVKSEANAINEISQDSSKNTQVLKSKKEVTNRETVNNSSDKSTNKSQIKANSAAMAKDYTQGKNYVQQMNKAGAYQINNMKEKELLKMVNTHNTAIEHGRRIDKNWEKSIMTKDLTTQVSKKLKEMGTKIEIVSPKKTRWKRDGFKPKK